MKSIRSGTISRDLRTLFGPGATAALSDAQLLDRFISRRDDAAFESLVRRHGPMVLGVCLRVLGNIHDAEDAFQAAFLVLARKASTVRPADRVGHWLHGVAYQTAIRIKSQSAKRHAREKEFHVQSEPHANPRQLWDEVRPILDQELNRLPEKYRAAVVLCDLEGENHKDAARRLGWPIGTLSGRLHRARALLAARLSRRGVALTAPTLALIVSEQDVLARMAGCLARATVNAYCARVGRSMAAQVTSNRVTSLAEGVVRSMMLHKLKIAGVAILSIGVAGVAMTEARSRAFGQSPVPPSAPQSTSDRPVRADSEASAGEPRADERKSGYTYVVEELNPERRALSAWVKNSEKALGERFRVELYLAREAKVYWKDQAVALEQLLPGVEFEVWLKKQGNNAKARDGEKGAVGPVLRVEIVTLKPEQARAFADWTRDGQDPRQSSAAREEMMRYWRELLAADDAARDEAAWVRRIYLDITGTPPTPEEVKQFIADRSKTKTRKLIDQLLERSWMYDRFVREFFLARAFKTMPEPMTYRSVVLDEVNPRERTISAYLAIGAGASGAHAPAQANDESKAPNAKRRPTKLSDVPVASDAQIFLTIPDRPGVLDEIPRDLAELKPGMTVTLEISSVDNQMVVKRITATR
jgi:RNA polymerase sigma factor (sigma-70 family)